jgi:hypothetical protein
MLDDALFLGFTLAYIWFGAKVDEWVTIAALGFKLETPQLFLQSPRNYDVIRLGLFIAACASLFGTTSIPWYAGAIVLGSAWFGTTWLGQRRAFATYRRICQEIVEDGETSEDQAWREAEARRSNEELRERILSRRKGI